MTLSEWRKRKKLTLARVAEAVGASSMSISRIEKGQQRPSPELASRIEIFTRASVTAASLLGLPGQSRRPRELAEEGEAFDAGQEVTIAVVLSPEQIQMLRRSGIDIEEVGRQGAELAIKEAEARAWAERNREAIEASNRWIEKHGTLAEQLGLI